MSATSSLSLPAIARVLSFAALGSLVAGASYGTPVDLQTGAVRPILVWFETSPCDASTLDSIAGCTITSSDARAFFTAPLDAQLTPSVAVAEVRILAFLWDAFLFHQIHSPAGGVVYETGSASDYVLQIDTQTGAVVFASWNARILVHGASVDLVASLVDAPGIEPYGHIAQGPLALVCGLNPGSPPDPGECEGDFFVPNEPYDPSTGFIHHAGTVLGPEGLKIWLPIDLALQVPEPDPALLLGIGCVLAAMARPRQRDVRFIVARPGLDLVRRRLSRLVRILQQ